jgi:hypothetical protein
MTTKNFNAKKMFMNIIAAVVFSFVFTTSANAVTPQDMQNSGIEIYQAPDDEEQGETHDLPDIIAFILEIFGVRV